MFSIVRLVIGFVFLGCSIAVIKKSKAVRKGMLYAVFSGISVALMVVLALVPFENLFLTFDSPEDAYTYYLFKKPDLVLVVEGDQCDFVVGSKNDSDTYLMIPKSEDGWKIGIGSNSKTILQKISNGITVYVYQYKNTKDYFITILDTNGGESELSDEYDTQFYPFEKNSDLLGKKFVTYYAHVPNYHSQYSVMVNGNEIVL